MENNKTINLIESAIARVTQLTIDDFAGDDKRKDKVYARWIFVYHCWERNVSPSIISGVLKRRNRFPTQALNKYRAEIKTSPYFRELAEKVSGLLIQ